MSRVTANAKHRVDRLSACGNGVVPAVATLAWRTLYAELFPGADSSEPF